MELLECFSGESCSFIIQGCIVHTLYKQKIMSEEIKSSDLCKFSKVKIK
jgi:hypothetical protein